MPIESREIKSLLALSIPIPETFKSESFFFSFLNLPQQNDFLCGGFPQAIEQAPDAP
jgi:hypothetical protein